MAETVRPITKAAALKVLAKVEKAFALDLAGSTGQRPWLAEPGHEMSGWAVSWEEGPYDWPFLFTEKAYLDPSLKTDGVFMEPVNGWALGLYRA